MNDFGNAIVVWALLNDENGQVWIGFSKSPGNDAGSKTA